MARNPPLEYVRTGVPSHPRRRPISRAVRRIAAMSRTDKVIAALIIAALVAPVLLIGLGVFGNFYASDRFHGVVPGMTRAQVERHLWAFTGLAATYQGMGPTDSAVGYEFLGFGKSTQIKIIYDANGVVLSSIPSFAN